MKLLAPPNPGTTTPVTVNLDGRILRQILAAQPATPETPRQYANELAPAGPNGEVLYRRLFNLASTPPVYPEHADVVFVDIRKVAAEGEPENPWIEGVLNFGPSDTEFAFITPDGERTEVRYRAVNPNGTTIGPVAIAS